MLTLVLNLGLLAMNVGHRLWSLAQINSFCALLSAIVLWGLLTVERRSRLRITTMESYLQEQLHDTAIKASMVEAVASGRGRIGMDGPPITRAH